MIGQFMHAHTHTHVLATSCNEETQGFLIVASLLFGGNGCPIKVGLQVSTPVVMAEELVAVVHELLDGPEPREFVEPHTRATITRAVFEKLNITTAPHTLLRFPWNLLEPLCRSLKPAPRAKDLRQDVPDVLLGLHGAHLMWGRLLLS